MHILVTPHDHLYLQSNKHRAIIFTQPVTLLYLQHHRSYIKTILVIKFIYHFNLQCLFRISSLQ